MKFIIVLSLSVLSISNAVAERFEPATVGNVFAPQFTTIIQYDDNIYTSEINPVSSFIYYLKPSIALTIDDGINRYGGEYILTSSFYSSGRSDRDGESDDMTDHQLLLFAHKEFTSKHRADINLGYDILHEKRGSGITEGYPYSFNYFPTPIDYRQLNTNFHYQFGGRNAKMRIGAGLSYYDKRYLSYTRVTQYSDFDALTFSADSDYQIGDVTYLTFDILTTAINYKHRNADQLLKNNQDSRALVGLTWRGASKISGRARLGYQYKTFDELDRPNFTGNTVDLRLNWSPKQRDTYFINLSRAAQDSDTVGDYIKNLTRAIGWQHQWTNKFDSSLEFEQSNRNYIGAARDDQITNINANLIYGFLRWLNLAVGFEHSVNSSNVPNIGYDQNIFTITLKVSL